MPGMVFEPDRPPNDLQRRALIGIVKVASVARWTGALREVNGPNILDCAAVWLIDTDKAGLIFSSRLAGL
jgi:hypothetical protein